MFKPSTFALAASLVFAGGLHFTSGLSAAPAHQAYALPELHRTLGAKTADEIYGVFLHFSGNRPAEQDALLARLGLSIHSDFRRWTDSVYVTGTVASIYRAFAEPSIYYIEYNAPLSFNGDTGPWASRARVAQEPVAGGPYTDGLGRPLRGQGIGIAIVDSGVNGRHPDLSGRIGKSYKIECALVAPGGVPDSGCAFVDVGANASTDGGGGHGTHVSGIALGDGSGSTPAYAAGATPNVGGSFTGVAPGATLYSFSTGEGLNILYAVQAVRYMLEHYEEFNPRIRVSNHSYGQNLGTSPTDASAETNPYNEADTERQLARRLIHEKGHVMTYSAGNNGPGTHANGPGNLRRTNASCGTPYLGVMCVANYDDANTGNRDNALDTSSSRAKKGEAQYYPDVAAPGANITSTCGPGAGAVCQTGDTRWGSNYGTISGTSMAAPHMAGVVALIRQARPDLTPAQVQSVIQNTARKVTFEGPYEPDPENIGGTHNFAVGAGLVDVPAILDALGVNHPGLPGANVAPPETVLLDADNDPAISPTAADVVKLTVQETPRGTATSGLRFKLTVRDTGFGSGVAYRLTFNLGGIAHSTGINALSTTNLVIPGGITAAPSEASFSGKDLSLFVPHARLGSPAVGTPVHNIRVRTLNPADETAAAYDNAPSRTASGNSGSAQADMEPGFAKPYTILRPTTGGPAPQNACTVPGITLLEDKSGDIFALLGGAPSNNNSPAYDLRSLSVVQPYKISAADYSIELYLKMEKLDPLPVGNWPVNFCSPAFACVNPDSNTAAYSATNQYYTVRMTTDSSVVTGATPQAPKFQLRFPTATSTSTGTRGTLDLTGNGSTVSTDGTIKFVLKATDIGLTAAGAGSQALSKFQSRVNAAGTPTPDNMPDGLVGVGEYVTLPLNQCDPSNLAPLPSLTANPSSSFGPIEVIFELGGTDTQDAIASYTLDFGDDSAQSGSNPVFPMTVRHSYSAVGDYTARLSLTDARRKNSAAPAEVLINIKPVPENVKPTAALSGTPLSGHGPLTVQFNAAGSSDSDGQIAEYRLSPGDGSVVIKSATAQMSYRYPRAGVFNATLDVLDNRGALSATPASLQVEVTNQAPTVNLQAQMPSDRRARLNAELVATAADADGDAITEYRFDCNYGNITATTTQSRFACEYAEAGTYQPSVVVVDSLGTVSSAASTTVEVLANQKPLAALKATGSPARLKKGTAQVTLADDGSSDPEGDRLVEYGFDCGNQTGSRTGAAQHVCAYSAAGTFPARLTVQDERGTDSETVSMPVRVLANALPTVSLNADQTSGRAPLTVNLSAADYADAEGDAAETYRFDCGNGNVVSGGAAATSAVCTYNDVRNYTASLAVTDDHGGTSTAATKTISALANQAPVARLTASANQAYARASISLNAATSTDPEEDALSYAFACGNGATTNASSVSSATCSYSSPGTYTAKVTVTDALGAASQATQSLVIDQNRKPSISLTPASSTGRAPMSITYTAAAADGDGDTLVSYAWNCGFGSTARKAESTHTCTYNSAGHYTPSVQVTDSYGSVSDLAAATVDVTAANTAPVARLAPSVTSGAAPLDVRFDGSRSSDADSGDAVQTYTFDFGDGSAPVTGPESAVSHRYTSAGSFKSSLVVKDKEGLASMPVEQTIEVRGPVTAALSATPATATAPADVLLDASGSTGSGTLSYVFDFGDGSAPASGSASSVSHTYTQAGRYLARVTVRNASGDSGTTTSAINIVSGGAASGGAASGGNTSSGNGTRDGGGALGLLLLPLALVATRRRKK